MGRIIRKVAVLGSGIMGTGIACHFANIGLEVILLGRINRELSADDIQKGFNESSEEVMNRSVNLNLFKTVHSDPSPLFRKDYISRIKTGNFETDFTLISECDWIIETVIEDVSIKKEILAKTDIFRKSGTLITTNTSGISVNRLAEGRSGDFRKNFCGTHFFNPPRYIRLVEIIPASGTDPEVSKFLMIYCDFFLGKKTIFCKDTPAFIANRIGVQVFLNTVKIMNELGLTIEEVDKLTGTICGRPKSATFRTSDRVGLDTFIKVASNLQENLDKSENGDSINIPQIIHDMFGRNLLGDKTGRGFYKKTKNNKGRTQILVLDFKNFDYRPVKKIKFKTIGAAKVTDNIRERLRILYQGRDIAGEFYRRTLNNLFQYVSDKVPEITELFRIDQAICTGFGWELGPFEMWDAIGMDMVLNQMLSRGLKPAYWVDEMAKSGINTFYITGNGIKKFYNIDSHSYLEIPGQREFIILENLHANKLVWNNPGCSLVDLGEGILNIEFQTKMNILGRDVIEGINKGIDLAEKEFRGLVIGNNGKIFTAGADLGTVFMLAIEQEYDELERAIKIFQDTVMRIRYSGIPVVLAPHDLTLGGGCEMSLHADHVQAAAESYIGLVEAIAGLIPGGGGTKEMTKRISEAFKSTEEEINAFRKVFVNIVLGKVSISAGDAIDMYYLRNEDMLTMNCDRLIADSREAAIKLAEGGYKIPDRQQKIRVKGKTGLLWFEEIIEKMRSENNLSAHGEKIAGKLAWIMCGGEQLTPSEVSEQYLLDLEREAFLSLCCEKKTLERIQAILLGKKPPAN